MKQDQHMNSDFNQFLQKQMLEIREIIETSRDNSPDATPEVYLLDDEDFESSQSSVPQ